jgi:WGR domain.
LLLRAETVERHNVIMESYLNQLWINPDKRRYYRVILSRDLFDATVLHCMWGGLDSATGNDSHEVFSDAASAHEKLERIRKRRQQRGYRLAQ